MKHHQIQYVEFLSNDFDRIKKFYANTFGWEFTDFGSGYTAFSGEHVDGGFAAGDPEQGSVLVILYSDNLDESKAKVLENGGNVTKDTFSFPGGSRFEFSDPDNNKMAVWSDK